MNARDGMQRLRNERRAYGLCVGCGKRLEKGYGLKNCPECLAREAVYNKRRAARRKKNEG